MPFRPNFAYALSVRNCVGLKSWHGRSTIPPLNSERKTLLHIWHTEPDETDTELATYPKFLNAPTEWRIRVAGQSLIGLALGGSEMADLENAPSDTETEFRRRIKVAWRIHRFLFLGALFAGIFAGVLLDFGRFMKPRLEGDSAVMNDLRSIACGVGYFLGASCFFIYPVGIFALLIWMIGDWGRDFNAEEKLKDRRNYPK